MKKLRINLGGVYGPSFLNQGEKMEPIVINLNTIHVICIMLGIAGLFVLALKKAKKQIEKEHVRTYMIEYFDTINNHQTNADAEDIVALDRLLGRIKYINGRDVKLFTLKGNRVQSVIPVDIGEFKSLAVLCKEIQEAADAAQRN